ncbi:MAG TPA: hypothetical protein VIL46_13275 [Gemmataceae bacterium]
MPTAEYLAGLDLGQSADFSALAVLERTKAPEPEDPGREVSRYAVRHLERFPLGTPYTEVCDRMVKLFAAPPLADGMLVVDQTGVGRPVVDLLRRSGLRAYVRPVTITAGHRANRDERGGWLVPKKELVSTLQVLLQARRIKVAPSLPEAETLVREMTEFRVKITLAANETFGAWREGSHDDLVLAVAVAAWWGERRRTEFRIW